MDRKRQRKDMLYISKRQFRRLIAQETNIICNSLLYGTSHDNMNNKCATIIDNCPVNSKIIHIEHNTEHNEHNDKYFQNENDTVRQSENKSDSQKCPATTSSNESSDLEFENKNITDFDFQDDLVLWAVQHQITHNALTALLHRLKKHSCFSTLPLDARSLLKTPKQQEFRTVVPGSYYHFGLIDSVKKILMSIKDNVNCIQIAVNIDGLPLSKSSQQQFWPILGSVLPYNNVSYDSVFIIGIYHGNEKPADANNFVRDFVNEAKEMCAKGIDVNGRNIQCRIGALICDTPAKAFVLCVKGHSGYSSCTKCTIEGEYIANRICFPQIDAPLRSDEDFVQRKDDDYHRSGTICSLLSISHFKPVTNVPLDYMHVVCLGIVRKKLYLLLNGELHYRLSHRVVDEISTRLTYLRCYIPVEFARKPRKLDCVKLWKATEYRLLLLYTGPLTFKSILKRNVYVNFITLHVIIRILSSKDLHDYLAYAQELTYFYIKTFIKLYGMGHVSHNIHSLIHLVNDVKRFGPLDNFSAFKFENYMQTLKKYIRKADKPLQQVVRRYREQETNLYCTSTVSHSIVKDPKLTSLHWNGPLIANCHNPQYNIIQYNGLTFKAGTLADSCCGLSCGAIVSIKNIAFRSNSPVIIGHEFLEKEELYNVPCPSSLLGIYVVHSYSDLKVWSLKNITRKYVQLPYRNDKYAIFPLIHGKI
ncbi:uncharacterized protein [Linepithema humile]|uniref:uncharacterized protein n=1 Tax=Linepithema humile TaxID=83485 RepID=UPI00351DD80D